MDSLMRQEANDTLKTLLDMVRWGVTQFNAANLCFGHGNDNAWDEALNLCLHALHLPFDCDPLMLSARLTSSERRKILDFFERRINERLPVAYLTQEAWFCGLSCYVDERVLVPRSPIAELIENNFAPWIAEEKVERILDLCTGSGCIAIACAIAFPDAQVDAADISTDALDVAAINCEKHHLTEHLKLINSDVFNAVQGRYDIIVSNPPYVSAAEMAEVPAEYHQEPLLGLQAEDEGLAIVIRILRQAHQHLTPHGILIVEVGNSELALNERFPQVPFTWLEFERGGSGVFLLTYDQLVQTQNMFN